MVLKGTMAVCGHKICEGIKVAYLNEIEARDETFFL